MKIEELVIYVSVMDVSETEIEQENQLTIYVNLCMLW